LEKRIQIVGWVIKLTIGLCCSGICFSQPTNLKSVYGLSFSAGYSGSVPAKSVIFAGPPFFTDLQVVNETIPNYSFEIFRDYNLGKTLALEQSIGYTTYNYITKYNYDYSRSFNNIVSEQWSHSFLDFSHRIKFTINLNNRFSIFSMAGLSLNYLTKANAKYVNFTNGINSTSFQSRTKIEPRYSFGYNAGVGLQYIASKRTSFQLRAVYAKLLKTYNNEEKRLYAINFGLGISRQF
jgi:opacity protein-like surface antigen